MNPIILYMASGESLYPGALLLLLLIAFTHRMTGRWGQRLRILATWIGAALIVMACPPFHRAFDAALVVAFVAWLALAGTKGRAGTRVASRVAAGVLAALLLAAVVLEWPHRFMPALSGPSSDHLVVLGDSISAGIAGDDARWPIVFTRTTGVPVINFAQPGAQVADALAQAKKVESSDTVVLLEIGGNDLIAGTSTADFSRDLDRLLAALARPGRTLVMFELPLLPHRIGYGASQRFLASKYHVTLIPKRYFVSILSGADATSDGLHLSPAGAQRMTDLVRRALGPALRVPY